jgi:uncharacterized membrane protein
MLRKLLINYLLKSILKSLKGKKRWLAILVLVLVNIAQSSGVDFGVDLSEFVESLDKILNVEGK